MKEIGVADKTPQLETKVVFSRRLKLRVDCKTVKLVVIAVCI
jgi:hypothetical protein